MASASLPDLGSFDPVEDARPCLLCVHAHPDDEASKGAGTVARYHAAGVHTVLVCCTGGEEGDILNPEMDRPEVRERLAEVRTEELRRSTEIIGYDARLPRLGDARHARQRAAGLLRPGSLR